MAGELLLSTLRYVWATLGGLNIEAALMGGIAVAAWHHLRNTRDVDLLVGIGAIDVDQLTRHLMNAGFAPARNPPLLVLGESRVLQFTFEPPERFLAVRVDLFLADCEFHKDALARRVELALPGHDQPVFVLSCEDLILFKLLAARLIDRSDAAYLLRFNRAELDLAYLRRWSARLALDQGLCEAWSEAFPDEEPPMR